MRTLNIQTILHLVKINALNIIYTKSLYSNKSFSEIVKLDSELSDKFFGNDLTKQNLKFHTVLNRFTLSYLNSNNVIKLIKQFINYLNYKKSIVILPNTECIIFLRENLKIIDGMCTVSLMITLEESLVEKGLVLLSSVENLLDNNIFCVKVFNSSTIPIVIGESQHLLNGKLISRS